MADKKIKLKEVESRIKEYFKIYSASDGEKYYSLKEITNEGDVENLYLTLQFEPIHQNNVTDEIKEIEKTLIHLTPFYYVGKIKHIGFSPRSKNKQFGYPDRVYFLKGSIDRDKLLEIAERLNYSNENKTNNGKYAIMTIDTEKNT